MFRHFVVLCCTALTVSVSAGVLPDSSITPGAVRSATVEEVCTPGSSQKARRVTESAKRKVFAGYNIAGNHQGECGITAEGCEIDHLISLELGGSNAVGNLWPQSYAGDWNAHQKDVLENKLHKLVCSGQISLDEAQSAIVSDWIAAYKKYVTPRRR